jgi:hypothetical protein
LQDLARCFGVVPGQASSRGDVGSKHVTVREQKKWGLYV